MTIEQVNWENLAVIGMAAQEKSHPLDLIFHRMGTAAKRIAAPDRLPKDWDMIARRAIRSTLDAGLAEETRAKRLMLTDAGRVMLAELTDSELSSD